MYVLSVLKPSPDITQSLKLLKDLGKPQRDLQAKIDETIITALQEVIGVKDFEYEYDTGYYYVDIYVK